MAKKNATSTALDASVLKAGPPKTPFMEFIERFGSGIISQIVWSEKRVEKGHHFECNIKIEGKMFNGEGASKKIAKQQLAAEVVKVFPPIPKDPIPSKVPKHDAKTDLASARMAACTIVPLAPSVSGLTPLKQDRIIQPPSRKGIVSAVSKTEVLTDASKKASSGDEKTGTPITVLNDLLRPLGDEGKCTYEVTKVDNVPSSESNLPRYRCALEAKGNRFTAFACSQVAAKEQAAKMALEKLFQYNIAQFDKSFSEQMSGKPLALIVDELCANAGYIMRSELKDLNEKDPKTPGLYEMSYIINGQKITGSALRSKKEAKNSACRAVFLRIFKKPPLEVEKVMAGTKVAATPPKEKHKGPRMVEQNPVSLLNVLCLQKPRFGSVVTPQYETVGGEGNTVAGVTKVKLTIGNRTFEASGDNKKQAKVRCAVKALKAVYNRVVPEQTVMIRQKRKFKNDPMPEWYRKVPKASIHTPIKGNTIGYKMLQSMGWRKGNALGKTSAGIMAPVNTYAVVGKGGLGSSQSHKKSLDFGSASWLKTSTTEKSWLDSTSSSSGGQATLGSGSSSGGSGAVPPQSQEAMPSAASGHSFHSISWDYPAKLASVGRKTFPPPAAKGQSVARGRGTWRGRGDFQGRGAKRPGLGLK